MVRLLICDFVTSDILVIEKPAMTIALSYFLMKLLRRVVIRCEGQFQEIMEQTFFLLHRSRLIAYPVRTRGRLDSTGSP